MVQTLRKKVEHWFIEWEKLYKKGLHTESLELYIAKKAIEDYKKNGQ